MRLHKEVDKLKAELKTKDFYIEYLEALRNKKVEEEREKKQWNNQKQ